MGDRCTGHCCRAFLLPMSPQELRQAARAWRVRQRTGKFPGPASNKAPPVRTWNEDVVLVAEIVRPLGFGFPQKWIPFTNFPRADRPKKPWHVYTCTKFDGQNCTIYDKRPGMCRSYPDVGTCEHPECGNTAWRPICEGIESTGARARRDELRRVTGCSGRGSARQLKIGCADAGLLAAVKAVVR